MTSDMSKLKYLVKDEIALIQSTDEPELYKEGSIEALNWVLKTIENG